jgi:nucleoside-diphosphate-sugar epimerase
MTGPLVLVTGAPGWIGSRFVELVVDGASDVPGFAADPSRRVRCLVYGGAAASLPPGVERVAGDLRDRATLAPFVRDAEGATLFHLGGLVIAPRVQDFHDVNVTGTQNLLAVAAEAGVRRVVALSSNAVVGWNPRPDHVFDETAPPNPHLGYATSKAMMETALREASDAGRIETVTLRPCRFYGPGGPPERTRFYRMIRAGRLPLLAGGRARWSLSYVDNTCQALALAGASPVAAGRTYWIADRRPYALREIVDTVLRVMERDLRLAVRRPRIRLPALAGRVADVLDRGLQAFGIADPRVHALAHLQQESACTIARAERELGYAPTIDLEEGTRRTLLRLRAEL